MAKDIASLSSGDQSALVQAIIAAGLQPALRSTARDPAIVGMVGDSRPRNSMNDTPAISKSMRGPLVWANILSGQRMILGANYAVSGSLTADLDGQVTQLLTTPAGVGYVLSGVNSLASNVTGAQAASEIIAACERMRAAGLRVILENEVGSGNLTAAQVIQLHALRLALADYASKATNVFLHDAMKAVMVANGSQVAFKPNVGADAASGTQDPTHLGASGAYLHAQSLLPLITALFPPRFGFAPQTTTETWAITASQVLENFAFNGAATGGTKAGAGSTDISGNVPAWWTLSNSTAGVTVAPSLVTDPDGIGQNLKLDIAFTGANQTVLLRQDVQSARYALGDVFEAYAKVDVPASSALRYATLTHDYNNGSTTLTARDGWTADTDLRPAAAYTAELLTRPRKLAGTKGFMNAGVIIGSAGAGSVSVTIRTLTLRKRSDTALF